MKRHLWFINLCVAALLSTTIFAATSVRPNFVFIFGEGQGWTSTSVQMDDTLPASKGDIVRTPNLEKIATQGMRFANFYAPSPRCTPSRASVFTGKSPAQLHMTYMSSHRDVPDDGFSETGSRLLPPHVLPALPVTETTIGELLHRAGYATAHFGKWHIGRINPAEYGLGWTSWHGR